MMFWPMMYSNCTYYQTWLWWNFKLSLPLRPFFRRNALSLLCCMFVNNFYPFFLKLHVFEWCFQIKGFKVEAIFPPMILWQSKMSRILCMIYMHYPLKVTKCQAVDCIKALWFLPRTEIRMMFLLKPDSYLGSRKYLMW